MGTVDATTRGGSGLVPATLTGVERAVMYNGKHCIILKRLQNTEDRYQVQLGNGQLLSVESKNVRPETATPIKPQLGVRQEVRKA